MGGGQKGSRQQQQQQQKPVTPRSSLQTFQRCQGRCSARRKLWRKGGGERCAGGRRLADFGQLELTYRTNGRMWTAAAAFVKSSVVWRK
jgi:hypothetical protein